MPETARRRAWEGARGVRSAPRVVRHPGTGTRGVVVPQGTSTLSRLCDLLWQVSYCYVDPLTVGGTSSYTVKPMAYSRCRTFLALLVAVGTTAPLLASRTADAVETRTFYATAVGGEELPPVTTNAHAALTAGLNDDGSLTYTVTSTGFPTRFRAAYLQEGPRGAAGPI